MITKVLSGTIDCVAIASAALLGTGFFLVLFSPLLVAI
jgi:hypothetical protein